MTYLKCLFKIQNNMQIKASNFCKQKTRPENISAAISLHLPII